MLREWLVWLKTQVGLGTGDMAVSWSDRLEGSLNFWSLVEGAHLLTLMLFFGTIAIVDLRMLGLVFRDAPFSRVSAKLLPLTIAGFFIVTITGLALFFAKPVGYYHNLFFRLKMVFLLLALSNLVVFHRWLQRDQALWDTAPRAPARVRWAGAASLTLWILVIACGRYIPANAAWFECGRRNPDLMNRLQDCAASESGAVPRDVAALATGAGHGQ
jgi:hypothetical protein